MGLIAAALVLVGGCTTSTTGAATPMTGSAAATSSAASNVPKVATPVDTSKYQQDPCIALTAAQLTSFQVTTQTGSKGNMLGQGGTETLGVNCTWLSSNDVGISVAFTSQNKQGLGYYYAKGGTPQRGADIDWQPTVVNMPNDGSGDCSISVGASDTAFYGTTVKFDTSGDPCALTQQVLSDVTSNLKSSG
jgi:hypothetical protein